MNNTMQRNDEARPEMDDLLHDYFQSKMPHPWPAFKAPKPMRTTRPVSYFARYSGRLALAACVALMIAGYLTLGGFFPRGQAPLDLHRETGDISKGHDKAPKTEEPMPTPFNKSK